MVEPVTRESIAAQNAGVDMEATKRSEVWDRTYLPGRLILSVQPYLDEYARRSAVAGRELAWHEVHYGSDPAERLHFFPAPEPDSPLVVFVYGGYWQELTEVDSSFAGRQVNAKCRLCTNKRWIQPVECVDEARQWRVTKAGEKCTSFAACMTLMKVCKNIDYDDPSGPLEFADPGEPSLATYVISEIQVDGTVKPLRSERAGP